MQYSINESSHRFLRNSICETRTHRKITNTFIFSPIKQRGPRCPLNTIIIFDFTSFKSNFMKYINQGMSTLSIKHPRSSQIIQLIIKTASTFYGLVSQRATQPNGGCQYRNEVTVANTDRSLVGSISYNHVRNISYMFNLGRISLDELALILPQFFFNAESLPYEQRHQRIIIGPFIHINKKVHLLFFY